MLKLGVYAIAVCGHCALELVAAKIYAHCYSSLVHIYFDFWSVPKFWKWVNIYTISGMWPYKMETVCRSWNNFDGTIVMNKAAE